MAILVRAVKCDTPLNLRFEPLYGLLFEIYFDIPNFNTLNLFDTPNKK